MNIKNQLIIYQKKFLNQKKKINETNILLNKKINESLTKHEINEEKKFNGKIENKIKENNIDFIKKKIFNERIEEIEKKIKENEEKSIDKEDYNLSKKELENKIKDLSKNSIKKQNMKIKTKIMN